MNVDQTPHNLPLRNLTAQEFIDIIAETDRERYIQFYQNSFIIIENAEIAEEIIITENIIVNSLLIIQDSIFSGGFTVKGGEFKEDFWIQGGEFREDFLIEGGEFNGDFRIEGGEFKGIFGIGNGTFNKDFTISGGEFKELFIINNGIFCRDFAVGNGTFEGDVVFMSGYFCTLRIDYLISTFRLVVGSNCQINSLLLYQTIPKDSLLQINCNLYYLAFENSQNFGTIVFSGLSFLEQPYVPKGVSLPDDYDRPKGPELQILSSDLGKTTFIGCDLSGFDLDFRNSKITDVFVAGTKMPNEITTTVNKRGKPDFYQQQLGYSQIKKIYEGRGDRVEANRYYAREMDAYYATLTWRQDFWEKLNLAANKFSTNHGQSWQKGLFTTLLVSGLFYILYCLLLGMRLTWPTNDAKQQFGEVLSYFLEFINPIHKADYVAQELLKIDDKSHRVIGGWARATEGLSRIFIAYFVYQLIQAFRKHGKASG